MNRIDLTLANYDEQRQHIVRTCSRVATLAGVAPLEASSAGSVRHRLNRQGNRRLNRLFHQITLTQQRIYPPAQGYLVRRKQQGRTPREARRALKRLRSVWRQWQACWSQTPVLAPAPG